MTSSVEDGEILTLKEVADFLKVTERTIYRLAAARKIPAFKVGGVWRFSRAEIDGWIQRGLSYSVWKPLDPRQVSMA